MKIVMQTEHLHRIGFVVLDVISGVTSSAARRAMFMI